MPVQEGLAVKVEERAAISLHTPIPLPLARDLLGAHDGPVRSKMLLLLPLPRGPSLHLLDHEPGIKVIAVPVHEACH